MVWTSYDTAINYHWLVVSRNNYSGMMVAEVLVTVIYICLNSDCTGGTLVDTDKAILHKKGDVNK